MASNNPARNPLAETALTRDEVRDGGQFVCYIPNKPETRRIGTFMGTPFVCNGGGLKGMDVVWVQWQGSLAGIPMRTTELGITPDQHSGEYGKHVSLPYTT